MITIWRFPIVLALSVLFGLPALQRLMMDPQSLFRAGLQYLGALTLAWFGVNMVFTVMEHYAQHNRRLEEQAEAERLAAELLEQKQAEKEAEEARAAQERARLAEELVQTKKQLPADDASPIGSPMPLGRPVSLDSLSAPQPAAQPSTASIAQDLIREEAGSGVI